MEKWLKISLSVLTLVILISAVFFTFFYSPNCESKSCFKAYQYKCGKAHFISESATTTWKYLIKGEKDEKCLIEATVLQVKKGALDRQILEGKSMECALRIGSVDDAEKDLTLCHGRLKEDIQELMIRNIHSEIASNLEDELKGIFNGSVSG